MNELSASWQDFTIREVLPHQGQMVLIDHIERYEPEGTMVCSVQVGAWSLFHNEDGVVPAHIGIEYMAQTVAAFFGMGQRLIGEPLEVGFLLGTRSMYIRTDAFQPGQQLTVTASKVYDYNGMGVFDCTISDSSYTEEVLLEGKVNVYRPPDLDAYLSQN